MYLIDDDKQHETSLQALTFAPGLCTDCGEDTQVAFDPATDEWLCVDCLDGAARHEAEQADADEWDALYRQKVIEAGLGMRL